MVEHIIEDIVYISYTKENIVEINGLIEKGYITQGHYVDPQLTVRRAGEIEPIMGGSHLVCLVLYSGFEKRVVRLAPKND